MKRLLALILSCLFIASSLVACSGGSDDEKEKKKDEIKGAEIQMFLTTLPESIDPSASYTTVDHIRLMGLLYEGLTTINEKGKLEKALCKSYEYDFNQRTGNLELLITLENSRWSDGNLITADDFRFAWKRVLLPENNNINASLLYPILNAKKVKEGLCSEDDFGMYSLKNNLIQITFEKDYVNEDDYSKSEVKKKVEYFLRRLASPALVPLREDVVDDDTKDWCKPNGTSYVTNGPFKIKAWNSGELTFERSVNYRCVGDSESNADDKIVKPYRLITLYAQGTSADNHYQRYVDENCFFLNLNSASPEVVSAFGKKVDEDPTLSSTVIYLDHTHELFANPKVRQALSMAIDRNAIAAATNSAAATGFVPTGVEDVKANSDFRKKGGNLWAASANVEAAKALLAEAGVKPANHVISIEFSNLRKDDEEMANAIQTAWKALGFKIKFGGKKQMYIDSKEDGTYELIKNNEAVNAASVIIVNQQSMTTDAYSILTSYSGEYGGNVVDVTKKDVVYGAHTTGYADAEYDKLCAAFANAENAKTRTAAMHEAEKYLAEQMPVIPLVFNNSYYVTQKLSGIETDKFGRLDFTELEQKNFKKYLKAQEEAEASAK
ncbi:MAG: hypothetical protein J6E38_04185 [Clostridia bacterium]|nr:hypothetical protein [Clostridia bacterium]